MKRRILRGLLAFAVGLILGGWSVWAMAETIPATYGKDRISLRYRNANVSQCSVHESVSALCSSVGYSEITLQGTPFCKPPSGSGGFYVYSCCPSNYTLKDGQCESSLKVYSCPSGQGWTLSGSTCTRPDCAPGETRGANGQCVPPLDYKTCAELVVTSVGSCVKSVPCGDASTVPLDVALTNAAVCSDEKPDNEKCPPGGIVIGEFQGKPICISPPPDDPTCKALGGTVTGTLNGQPVCSQANNGTCADGSQAIGTANGQPVCSGNCPSGTAPGTVNGVESCYPISKTTDKTTTQKGGSSPDKTTTTTTDNGDGTSTTTTTTTSSATTCSGDRCTTTTTTSGEGGDSTTQTEQDKGDFCRENPKAAVCKGETEEERFCKENPDAVQCMEAGTPPEEGGLPTVEKGISSITPVAVAGASGCPADVYLPHGAVFSYAPACMYAEGLRPVILASAWLAAGLILFGFLRS